MYDIIIELPTPLTFIYDKKEIFIDKKEVINIENPPPNRYDNYIIGFTLSASTLSKDIFLPLKDWYDLSWNNETGQLKYIKPIIGHVRFDICDSSGCIIGNIRWYNCIFDEIKIEDDSITYSFRVDCITYNDWNGLPGLRLKLSIISLFFGFINSSVSSFSN